MTIEREAAVQHPREVFSTDEVSEVLRRSFYQTNDNEPAAKRGRPKGSKSRAPREPKPEHYEIICISMYREDLTELDAKVDELKKNGHRRISRSSLIRYALSNVNTAEMPRGF